MPPGVSYEKLSNGKLNGFVVYGYWTDLNNKLIKYAYFGDTVRFNILTALVPDGEKLTLQFYDKDWMNDTKVGSQKTAVVDGTIAHYDFKIKTDWEDMVNENGEGSFIELYCEVIYKGKAVDLAYEDNLVLNVSIEDDYAKAIKNGKISYSCHCGWIDKTHAFTDTKRTESYIGAKNLWYQILNETGTKSRSPNEKGFKVTYRQDATVIQNAPVIGPVRLGTTKSYFVKYGLSQKQKEEVTLAIFKEVSIEFESFQSFGAVMGKGASSFEPADLISNLISFYRVVRPDLTKDIILNKCGELTSEKSLEVYKKYPGTFTKKEYKNRKFTPRYFSNDNCSKFPVFPKELQAIKDIEKGNLFRDWLPLIDIHAGIPPINGPKF